MNEPPETLQNAIRDLVLFGDIHEVAITEDYQVSEEDVEANTRVQVWETIKASGLLNGAPTIRRGFSDWFYTRTYGPLGNLTEESLSRPRTVSAVLSLALILYVFAPFAIAVLLAIYPAAAPAMKGSMEFFKLALGELKWPIVAGVFGMEAVRAMKDGAFMRPLSPRFQTTAVGVKTSIGGPEK